MSRVPGGPEFVARQRAACEQSQRGLGLAAEWADQIPGFLDSVALRDEEPVLLHTEVMRQHLLVEPGPWRLVGLIDFEPALPLPPGRQLMAGPPNRPMRAVSLPCCKPGSIRSADPSA